LHSPFHFDLILNTYLVYIFFYSTVLTESSTAYFINASVDVIIKTKELWSGEKARDDHLKSKDFLYISKYPTIKFKGKTTEILGPNDVRVTGKLTIRGITKKVHLDVKYHGSWNTSYWVGGKDKGPIARAGFVATTKINRHDFGVNWNSPLEKGGFVVATNPARAIGPLSLPPTQYEVFQEP